jgi:uncharacterized protein YkwD
VLLPRNHLAIALIVLSYAALSLPASAGAARTATHPKHALRSVHRTRAHAGCAARSAAAHRAHGASRTRARAAARGCHKSLPKAPRTHSTRPRKPPAARPGRAAASEAPVASTPTSQETQATIASVLNTPCQDTELTPEAANLPLVHAAVLCLINQERASNGRLPLTANADLEQAAEGHTQELVQDDYFAHVTPGGETPVDRIRNTGYIPGPSVGYVIGENLAWGTYALSTPRAIVAAWIASPGHLANILEAQYTETGIGITTAVPASLGEGQPGATYAQEFAVIKQ